MKKSGFIWLVIACFLGVFGALQLDRYLQNRHETAFLSRGQTATTVGYDAAALPADFRATAKKILPSVVSVDRYESLERMDMSTVLQETGTASGVIVTGDGIIVTNNHVVAGASQVRVRLSDKRTFRAKVLGTDERSDVAVLKIDAADLTPIAAGDSSKVEVGQWVVAVGNPLGYEGTVSVGVVSSLGRSLMASGGEVQSALVDAIQTDAAINAGNSGGALTDANGNLIGLNSAIASTSGGSIGIGFAIPVNHVKRVVDDIIHIGHVRYGGLGVNTVAQSDAYLTNPSFRNAMREELGAEPPETGLIVRSVQPGGAAEKVGVSQYDVLLKIDDVNLTDILTLTKVMRNKHPGDTIKLSFWHKGSVKSVNVPLQELPS